MRTKKSGAHEHHKVRRRCTVAVAGVFACVVCHGGLTDVPAAAAESIASDGVVTPAAEEIEQEQALIREAFSEEYDRAPEFPLQLAEEMLNAARATKVLARKWVLLSEAQRLAVVSKSHARAVEAATLRADEFGLEPEGEVLEALVAIASEPDTDSATNFRLLIGLAEDAIAARNLRVADKAVGAASGIATKIDKQEDKLEAERRRASRGLARPLARKGEDMLERVRKARRIVADLQERYDTYTKACEVLAMNPDDPAANRAAGEYLCFVLNRWDEGVPLLCRSEPSPLQNAAVAEAQLTAAGQPALQAVFAVVEAWWEISDATKSSLDASVIKKHAVSLYDPVQAIISDPTDRTLVERRRRQAAEADKAANEPGSSVRGS